MKNKKRAVLIGSLQATVASLLALSQLYKTLENCKIKKKLKCIHHLSFPSLTYM